MSERVSVVFICEQPELLAGTGCCRLSARDDSVFNMADLFKDVHDQRKRIGLLYRVLRRLHADDIEAGRLTIVCVDPRNQLYLVPKLFRDVFRHRPGWKAGLQALLQAYSLPAVLVNGRPLSRRGVIDPDELCHEIAKCQESRVQSRSER